MNEAVVYYRRGCPFAARLRLALTFHRVPFTSVRFPDDEAATALVRAANDGSEVSPTVAIDGQWLTNPSWREVASARSGRLR